MRVGEATLIFGKYKGEKLKDIPHDYLVWLYKQDWAYPSLKQAIYDLCGGVPKKKKNKKGIINKANDYRKGIMSKLDSALFDIGFDNGVFDEAIAEEMGDYSHWDDMEQA